MADCVAIISGGMDSVTLLHYLVKDKRRQPTLITFQYGQKHAKEIACARHHAQLLGCAAHQIVDISPLRNLFQRSALVSEDIAIPTFEEVEGAAQPSTYVPNRNMVFLALAAAYAETLGVNSVYYGAQAHDLYGYWDTTPQFIEALNRVYALNRRQPVQIHAPFVGYTKAEVLKTGLALGVDYSTAWSCYVGEALACGKCPTCAERLKAFAELGLSDPLPYASP